MSDHQMTFSKMPLDRCSSQRKDKSWLASQIQSGTSLFIPIWRGSYFFVENNLLQLSYHELTQVNGNLTSKQPIFLGLESKNSFQEKRAVFVIDCSEYSQEKLHDLFSINCELVEFRNSIALLSTSQSAILSYGKSLSHWHNSNQYCGYWLLT